MKPHEASRAGLVKIFTSGALAIICLITALICNAALNRNVISADGLQNYQGAYNLAKTGTLSFNVRGAGQPSMAREPLPPALLAVWLMAVSPNIEQAEPSAVNGEPAVLWVKRFNVVVAVLIVLATFLNAILLTRSSLTALCAAALVGVAQSYWDFGLNSMYTEPLTSLVLLLASAASIYWVSSGTIAAAAAFGVVMGLLPLTKAVGLTIFLPALFLVCALAWASSRNMKRVGIGAIVSVLAFGLIVGIWIIRNEKTFGDTSIAMRGGRVLYYRSMLSNMPPDTYRASFYAWSPRSFRPFMESVFGFSPDDLREGGAGQWLNRNRGTSFAKSDREAYRLGRPELASTYLWQMRSEYKKRRREFDDAGDPFPDRSASELDATRCRRFPFGPPGSVLCFAPAACMARNLDQQRAVVDGTLPRPGDACLLRLITREKTMERSVGSGSAARFLRHLSCGKPHGPALRHSFDTLLNYIVRHFDILASSNRLPANPVPSLKRGLSQKSLNDKRVLLVKQLGVSGPEVAPRKCRSLVLSRVLRRRSKL